MLMFIRKMMKNDKGFTLIELMVVVIILGILAAVAIPKFTGQSEEARANRVYADLKTIQNAVELYFFDNSVYPASVQDLLDGEYLKTEPTDPWGDGTQYQIDAAGEVYFNSSHGNFTL